MFKIFSGRWRGVGAADSGSSTLFMQIGLEFKNYLHHFKGAPLAVFMAIVLHSDENGIASPSYDLLKSETGLSRETISRAISHLCALEIEGQRVLLRYRERDLRTNLLVGAMRYIVFPTPEQLAEFQSDSDQEEAAEGEQDQLSIVGFSDSLKIRRSNFSTVSKSNLNNNHYLTRSSSSSSAPAVSQSQMTDQTLELYRKLRPGHVALPDTHWRERAEMILQEYLDRCGDVDAAAEKLRPYAAEAERRGLSPTNLCWLTEWAAVGGIPPLRAKGKSKGKANADANAESDEELARRRQIAAEKLGKFIRGTG